MRFPDTLTLPTGSNNKSKLCALFRALKRIGVIDLGHQITQDINPGSNLCAKDRDAQGRVRGPFQVRRVVPGSGDASVKKSDQFGGQKSEIQQTELIRAEQR